MSPPLPAQALYLRAPAGPVFGLFHPPRGERPGRTAILLCPPFGWEEVCSYRSRREWAQRLAAAGYATLRIDLPGTGDSGGSSTQERLLDAWIEAVAHAARWLADGHERVSVIGIGLGGLIACAALARGAPLEDAVLWGAAARGAALVRELRAFERMEAARVGEARSVGSASAGSLAAGGFSLPRETVQALERLDLGALALPHGRPRRVLLLERDRIRVDEDLRALLERGGSLVEVAPGDGYGAMMAEPQEATAPIRVFAQIEAWLAEGPAVTPQPSGARRPAPGARVEVPVTAPELTGTPAVSGTAVLRLATTTIREAPLTISQPSGALFGILAEPAEAPARRGQETDLGVVLLNAGAIRRIGPNRMWVQIARRWAARGIPTLRLDLEGLGDADGDDTRFTDVAELYVPGFIEQVRCALDLLESRGAASRFVLAGLCSGAYWSFHGALEDERVVAAFMLNPRTLFWDRSVENIRYLRRGLLKPSSWRMIARGDVSLARIGRVASSAPQSLAASALARWRLRREIDELDLALDRLCATGKQLAFVFSGNEPLHEELKRQGRLEQERRWPNIALEELPGDDHTLRPSSSQHCAHDALDRALERELQRLAA